MLGQNDLQTITEIINESELNITYNIAKLEDVFTFGLEKVEKNLEELNQYQILKQRNANTALLLRMIEELHQINEGINFIIKADKIRHS